MKNDMQDGFYWIQLKGDPPVVVEKEQDNMYFVGIENEVHFKDGKWLWEVSCGDPIELNILWWSGPLEVPTDRQRSTI